MHFRITPHSAAAPPPNALELLWTRLDPERGEMSFANAGNEIEVRTGADAPVSMTSDERTEIGRRAVLKVVLAVCEDAPELSSDWYAVSSEL
ncbi:MAG TPA: hypothetical protein VK765_04505 [Solirubrobacteraceae bacterium]|nr:hypothetical protein [Solirubrobacteraceae bacterium]